MKLFLKSLLLFLITGISCDIKSNDHQQELMANVVEKNDSVIVLRPFINTTAAFYFIKGLTGTPLNLVKGEVVKIVSKKPVYLMEATALQEPFILNPGDSVDVLFDNNQFVFKTNDSTRNNELNVLKIMTNEYGSLRPLAKTTYLKGKITLSQRDSLIEKTYIDRVSFLKEYDNEHTISKPFYNTVKQLLFYSRLNEKMNLYYTGFNKADIYNFYKDSLKQYLEAFNCDSCLDQPIYTIALIDFVRLQIRESFPHNPVLFLNRLNLNELHNLEKIAQQLNGKTKDFMLAKIAQSILNESQRTKTPIDINSVLAKIQSEEYRNSINDTYRRFTQQLEAGPIENQKLYLNDFKSYVTFQSLLHQHKGKVIYIDVWATWCLPCMKELPFSKNLAAQYKDKLEVFFFSVDSDSAAWKNYSDKNILSKNSFLLKNEFRSVFAKYFKIISIPRYILIDKMGKVITSDAPVPSDSHLKTLLDKYL